MAKTSGADGSERLFVDGINVSGNIGAINTAAVRRALTDLTDITQSAIARAALQADGELAFNSWWDGTPTTGVNETFKTVRADAHFMFTHGTALTSPAFCLVAHQADYSIPRSPDGTLAATIAAQSTGGNPPEWGFLATSGSGQPYQTFASAGNGSDCDDLAGSPTSTAAGAALYVHCISIASGSFTVKVQDAATLPTYADVAGLVTTSISAAGARRAVSTSPTATIRRYTRIVLAGTFTNAVIVAAIIRPLAV